MKTVMLTLALLMSAPAYAQEVYRVRTNTCGEYRGSWASADALRTWNEVALVRCEVDEDPQFATCTVNIGGGTSYDFVATKVLEDGLIKWKGFDPQNQDFLFELRCKSSSNCMGWRAWSATTKKGLQCARL